MRTIRNLRLATGLILATFVVVHLTNHALGIVSVDAQEAMREVVNPVYRNLVGGIVLYGAFVTHFALGLWSLWRRSTLRLPAWERAQLLLGLLVPPLLIPHAVGVRGGAELLGTHTTYPTVLTALWSGADTLIRQPILVVVISAHLAIGLHFWLRIRAGYRRWLPVVYPIAVLLPVLALLGFWRAGLEVRDRNQAAAASAYGSASGGEYGVASEREYGTASARKDAPPERDYGAASERPDAAPYDREYGSEPARNGAGQRRVDPARRALLDDILLGCYGVYVGGIAGVLLAREARGRLRLAQGSYRVHHASGRTLQAPLGQSVLEALRDAGIRHASVCGGRARCTTCRVRVGPGIERLPAPNAAELLALARIGAAPNVRLACQLRPASDVYVTPLVPADATPAMAGQAGGVRGVERRVVVMFVDLRESSRLGEERLPYDVIFILNRFFAEMAEALRTTGGYYSTFNGDGLMALYGIDADLGRAARDAMRGSITVSERLEVLNRSLATELKRPLKIGIGLHAGEAIVGTMGPPATPILSALGDTVNVAARLEGLTRDHDCMLVVSEACASAAKIDLSRFRPSEVVVRGRQAPVRYFAIDDPLELSPMLDAAEAAPTPAPAPSPDAPTAA